MWHDLEEFRNLYSQEKNSLLWIKLEYLGKFVQNFDEICDSTVVEAHRLLVAGPQSGEETWHTINLTIQIRYAAYALGRLRNGSLDSGLLTNNNGKNEELFSTLITQERLLSKDLAQGNTVKAEENRRKLIELYDAFPIALKKVLHRLGLDEAIGILVTLPLHRAVRLKDTQTLKDFLRCGGSSYSVDYIGRTALHVAAENNAIQMVNVLQSPSTDMSDIDQLDIFGRSPLYLSIQAGHTELVRKLLSLGGKDQREDIELRGLYTLAAESGNVALVRILLLAFGGLGMAPDSVKSAGLIAAASSGDLETVQLFVAANADLDSTAGGDLGALDVAIKAGHYEIASFLLSVNTKIDAPRDRRVMAPIHHAIERGNREIFDLLLKAGADINASFERAVEEDVGYRTPRMTTAVEFASEIGNLHALRQLLKLPELAVNRELRAHERSPLELAAKKGHGSAVDLLLSHGADVNISYRRPRNTTPLLEAVSGGYLSITKALIEAGAEVNALYSQDEGYYKTMSRASALAGTAAQSRLSNRTEAIEEQVESKSGDEGEESDEEELEDGGEFLERSVEDTALQLAARLGNIEIIQILLETGANVDAPPQRYGGTALQYAASRGHTEIVQLLLDAGAAVEVERGRMTALQRAAKGGHCWIVELLLKRKAQVDARSRSNAEGTPLQLAAKGGHLRTVRLLLDWHAEINCQSPGLYDTPLQAAVRRQHIDVVRTLLVAGADPNAPPGTHGSTALGCALANGNLEITRRLLIAGARTDLACRSGPSQCTALQKASQLGHIDIACLLLQRGADPNGPVLNDNGLTTLQCAVQFGSLELASILLKAGADVNGQLSPNGMSALSYSLQKSHQNIARLLIDAGAEVNATSESHLYYATALQIAAKNGLCESVDRLVYAGANVNAITKGGGTALSIATQNNRSDVVYLLLKANADVNIGHPLERAVQTNQTAVVKLLLGKGADVNSVSDIGFDTSGYSSPMESAVLNGSLNVMQLLLDAGTDSEILGYSLSIAAENNYLEKLRFLLAARADPNVVYRGGKGALYKAASRGHLEVIRFLLGAGADPNIVHRGGESALHEAASRGHLEVIRFLLGAGADPNIVHRGGESALHEAASRGHLEVIRFLLDAGADPNVVYRGGQGALYKAASRGHLKIVRLLLGAGADPNLKNIYGENALTDAVQGGNLDIVRLLLGAGADPNLKSTYGENALGDAVQGGNLDIVRSLLLAGADANSKITFLMSGMTALHIAAEKGRSEMVQLLLIAGADRHATTTRPWSRRGTAQSALDLAILSGSLETVQILRDADRTMPQGPSHKRKRVETQD